MENTKNQNGQAGILFTGVFVALGLAIAGYFIGQTLYNAKVAINTAEAKGLAERKVMSDRAVWKIGFTVAGKTRSEVPDLYQQAEQQQKTIIGMLRESGFEETEIKQDVLDYIYREYRDDDKVLVDEIHSIAGGILVETTKVNQIEGARAKVNKLIAEGIDISNWAPSYYFTKLNEIKPDMLRDATRNARVAANEFAENAGVEVGGIRSARQGSFEIRDAGESRGSTQKIEKDVRVVTSITFFLTE